MRTRNGTTAVGPRRRRGAGALAVAALTLLSSFVLGMASAAPASASTATPALFLHGFGTDGWDCRGWFTTMRNQMRADGWTGDLDTIKFYDRDYNCNVDIRGASTGGPQVNYTANTPIDLVGRDLAWYIHTRYSSRGGYVNLVGHSMGGLVIRDAVSKSAAGWSGYPPALKVSRVVTFSTPYDGARLDGSQFCSDLLYQCVQMRSKGPYLLGLPNNVGTATWLALGSNSDPLVSCRSALTFGQRKACWDKPDYDHQNAMWDTATSFSALLDPNVGGTYVGSYWHGVRAVEEHFR